MVLPIFIILVFAVLEASQACMIKEGLQQAARQAARSLAIAYGNNQGIAGNRSQENSQVFDTIRIQSIVNSSNQFSDPVWNQNSNPPTVTATCTYLSNQYGLPQFPAVDPLQLSSNFTLSSSATYRLE